MSDEPSYSNATILTMTKREKQIGLSVLGQTLWFAWLVIFVVFLSYRDTGYREPNDWDVLWMAAVWILPLYFAVRELFFSAVIFMKPEFPDSDDVKLEGLTSRILLFSIVGCCLFLTIFYLYGMNLTFYLSGWESKAPSGRSPVPETCIDLLYIFVLLIHIVVSFYFFVLALSRKMFKPVLVSMGIVALTWFGIHFFNPF